MLDVYQIPPEEIEKIEWQDDPVAYDYEIYKLGGERDEFIAVNPDPDLIRLSDFINEIPEVGQSRCIVWKNQDRWVAKYFTKPWVDGKRYKEVELNLTLELVHELIFKNETSIIPNFANNPLLKSYIVWERNPDIDNYISFKDDPTNITLEDLNDLNYEMVWHLDPKFNPTDEKIWAVKAHLKDYPNKGTKEMGYLSSNIRIKFNPEIPILDYELDYSIPYYDLNYEFVWYLDPKFNPTDDKIWAVKLKLINGIPKPTKEMGFASPTIIYNPELPKLEYIIEENIPYYDLKYTHIWLVDENITGTFDDVWAAKIIPHESEGITFVGNIKINLPKLLDVVFISYNEPNAETNWQRVLEKAPYAKRINGIKGIAEAHRCAAELATTDMFYVVDGDAWLVDNWKFDYQPYIFDRDCVFVWHSINPINDLEYGYGGVKLLPRELTLSINKDKPDITTSISNKIKVVKRVSNVTAFNNDAFNTWKYAFRECVKLSSKTINRRLLIETDKRLDIWNNIVKDVPYSTDALAGAVAGTLYGKENSNDPEALELINDFEWLHNLYSNKNIVK